ncbi:antibiotic biosynthesis monooxygenase [Streptomyces phaeochromogenes]
MAIISPDSGYLTVLNIFRADAPEKQDRLLGAMQEIVNAAAYEGWVSSTVHSGVDRIGTANFIQWERQENLEQRYASDEFQHQIPMFAELTTWIRLLQTEVAYTQLGSAPGAAVEISPDRDDYTVIEIFRVEQENMDRLVTALGKERDWLPDIPGYRSHSVLRGKALRGKWAKQLEGSFVVCYSQWDGKESFDAFLTIPEREQSAERRRVQAELDAIVTSLERNTYRAVHSRSAGA